MVEQENDKREGGRVACRLVTGPILFGGIKLAYPIGNDALSSFRSDEVFDIHGKNGVALQCLYFALDSLSARKLLEIPLRLRRS